MNKLRVDEGEAGELGLVDVGDDQLVRWCELGLGAREELVEVLRSFAALEKRDRAGLDQRYKTNTASASRLTRRSRHKEVWSASRGLHMETTQRQNTLSRICFDATTVIHIHIRKKNPN